MPVIAASDLLLVGAVKDSSFLPADTLPSSVPSSSPSFFPGPLLTNISYENPKVGTFYHPSVLNVTSLLSILNFRINLLNCSFVYSLTHLFMYLGDVTHVDIRGQLAGVFSLHLPCSSWAQVKGCQAWWQRFLSAEMPLCPFAHICKILFYF